MLGGMQPSHLNHDLFAAMHGFVASDAASGQSRLVNLEMLPLMVDWVVQSEWLPSTVEFSTVWENVLRRLPRTGVSQLLQIMWRSICLSGDQVVSLPLGAVDMELCRPVGTYDSNTLERAWRTLKGLLGNRRGTAKIHHYGGRLEIQPRWLMFATFSKQIWQLSSMTT